MSGVTKKLMSASGGAAGFTAIEDVFSTYLYTGNGFGQTITNGINLGTEYAGPSLEFDGVNDFLSRSSDLSGNVDGKQVTFSAWISPQKTGSWTIYSNDTFKFTVFGNESQIIFVGRNASGTNVVYAENTRPPFDTIFSGGNWYHILISFDLSNAANRYVYINDVAISMDWNTYTNSDIDFTNSTHYIGDRVSGGYSLKSYLSNVFLDYTYRDMSLEANRRLFITENLTPASGQENLSPILYLPMTTSAGTNAGTGGDFTINGNPQIEDQFGPFTSSSGEGGLVWAKGRSGATDHQLFDTLRGATKELISNSTAAEATDADTLTAFNADGFSLGADANVNTNAANYASWTFRKAPRFFDVVTYTGTGSVQNIPHNLGVVPGFVVVKSTTTADAWKAQHISTGATNALELQDTRGATDIDSKFWNDTAPTDSVFTVGTSTETNGSGKTFVAYLFAHDPLGPSGDGSDGLIACGSVSGFGTVVNLGWEPQWILMKQTNGTSDWILADTMRGIPTGSQDALLFANTSGAETSANDWIDLTSTGFVNNVGSGDFIYIAIRRGPMRAPTSGTEVFATQATRGATDGTASSNAFTSGFPIDLLLMGGKTAGAGHVAVDRLRGNRFLRTQTTDAEVAWIAAFDDMDGLYFTATLGAAPDSCGWMFRRAPEFFDVVAYTGDGTNPRLITHNLGVAPELVIVKKRSGTGAWFVKKDDISNQLALPFDNGAIYSGRIGAFTGTTFEVFSFDTNVSNDTYIAYLFATLAGVSKVGSYTGNGSSQTINCGFTTGARFILIKRTDSTGDWYVWDTARGIIAGNDPHLSLNTTAAEVTTNDSVDPVSSGFIVNQVAATNINVSAASYIFYAVA